MDRFQTVVCPKSAGRHAFLCTMMPSNAPIRPKSSVRTADGNRAGFAARLQLVVRHWPSAERLARAVGVSPSAFRKWVRGAAEPGRDRLVALAEATGANVAWLAQGEGASPDPATLAARARSPQTAAELGIDHNIEQFLLLPKRPEGASAGSGRPVAEVPTEFVGFRRDWLRTTFHREPDVLILEVAIGDSMEPNIRDGDLLLVDTSYETFLGFGVYVIEARGQRLVKRVQRKFDGSLILVSDNASYQPESIPKELVQEIRVIGRVIWRGGQI
jgi:phage repressor protein C with HTH and peptisase S24 domain